MAVVSTYVCMFCAIILLSVECDYCSKYNNHILYTENVLLQNYNGAFTGIFFFFVFKEKYTIVHMYISNFK